MHRRHFLMGVAALVGWAGQDVWAYRGGLKAHKYVFVGKMIDRSSTTLTVQGKDSDGQITTIPFALDHDSKLPSNLETGDTVVVHYDYTLESNVYAADEVTLLPPGYTPPKSTFPDQRQPTDKT